jgi:dTDP-4-dehydrorhamnose 3,5-epimerase
LAPWRFEANVARHYRQEPALPHFTRHPTPIPDLFVIERKRLQDERGFFSRLFCAEELSGLFCGRAAQASHSMTRQSGVIRGMHFQRAPHAETKVVTCIAGAVFDVAVDMRPDSPTYLRWHGQILSAENGFAMVAPRGFAHGFQTLAEECQLIYFTDEPYTPASEGGLHALDPRLAIDWPLPVTLMSERDRAFPMIGAPQIA